MHGIGQVSTNMMCLGYQSLTMQTMHVHTNWHECVMTQNMTCSGARPINHDHFACEYRMLKYTAQTAETEGVAHFN